MSEQAVNPPAGERRVALEKRRRVAEMSPDEMRRELLTSEVTGLPNRRAFDEADTARVVAMSDVDGLKALNKYGYEVGDAVLKAKAGVLLEVGLEAYHEKGDEFLCRGTDIKELMAKLERARVILRNRPIFVERADGSTLGVTGADFSYGAGKDLGEAELRLRNHKAEREGAGQIARGELCAISIRAEETDDLPSELSTLERLAPPSRREATAATS